MTRSKIRQFVSDTDGAALPEAALIMPLFLIMTLGTLLWALTLWEQIILQHAVEIEARCATLPGIVAGNATPYCGYLTCTSGPTCAVIHAFGLTTTTSNFNSPTTTSGSSFCAQTTTFANPFYNGFIPGLPTNVSAQYCRVAQ